MKGNVQGWREEEHDDDDFGYQGNTKQQTRLLEGGQKRQMELQGKNLPGDQEHPRLQITLLYLECPPP